MLLNFGYAVLLLLAAPWILHRAVRHGRYRRGLGEKLWGLSRRKAAELRFGPPPGNASSPGQPPATGQSPTAGRPPGVAASPSEDPTPLVWLHAVSVGEVNLLPALLEQLQHSHPRSRIVVSTSTDTGYDLAVDRFGSDRVFFCPLDFTWATRRTVRRLGPSLLVLTELELWPHLIQAATDGGCPVAVINARLSQSSAAGYQRLAWLTKRTFSRLAWVGCQDEATRRRFVACGVAPSRAEVTGSIKFDNAADLGAGDEVESRARWAGLRGNGGVPGETLVWCFGSTQPGEESMALRVYRELVAERPQLRLILAPRHPERFDAVARLIEESGYRPIRRSRNEAGQPDWPPDAVVLVDTIGELRHWWGVSQIATVGGTFADRGGQNLLEPAGHGCVVSFGPDYRNFADIARRLMSADAGVCLAGEDDLRLFLAGCLDDPHAAAARGQRALALIRQHRGASARTVNALTAVSKSLARDRLAGDRRPFPPRRPAA